MDIELATIRAVDRELNRLYQVEIDDLALLDQLALLLPYIQHLAPCDGESCTCGMDAAMDTLDHLLIHAAATDEQEG